MFEVLPGPAERECSVDDMQAVLKRADKVRVEAKAFLATPVQQPAPKGEAPRPSSAIRPSAVIELDEEPAAGEGGGGQSSKLGVVPIAPKGEKRTSQLELGDARSGLEQQIAKAMRSRLTHPGLVSGSDFAADGSDSAGVSLTRPSPSPCCPELLMHSVAGVHQACLLTRKLARVRRCWRRQHPS